MLKSNKGLPGSLVQPLSKNLSSVCQTWTRQEERPPSEQNKHSLCPQRVWASKANCDKKPASSIGRLGGLWEHGTEEPVSQVGSLKGSHFQTDTWRMRTEQLHLPKRGAKEKDGGNAQSWDRGQDGQYEGLRERREDKTRGAEWCRVTLRGEAEARTAEP